VVESGGKVERSGFSGGSEHSVDDKGRVIIPIRFREELGKNFVITRGMGKCLFVLTEDYWYEHFDKAFKSHNTLDRSNILLQRHFAAEAAMETNIDNQGRVPIPASLREYADIRLDRPVMVLGVTTRLEIWNKDRWTALAESTSEEDLSAAADRVGLGSVL
jgi:MraZ protein